MSRDPRAAVLWQAEHFAGHSGRLDGRAARHRNLGDILNLLNYRDGSWGPRPGLKAVAATGLNNGVVSAFGFAGTPGNDLWAVIGTKVRVFPSGGGASTEAGTIAVTPDPNAGPSGVEVSGSFTYLTVPGDKTYKLNHTGTPALTSLAGSPGGNSICVYGERMIVGGGNSTYPNRVFYSAAADFTSWPAGNYFDVGAGPAVRFVGVQRDHLVIITQDGTIWVLTGVPGDTSVLRRVSGAGSHPWHFWGSFAAVLPNQELVLVPVGSPRPAVFNGATIVDFEHLGLGADTLANESDAFRVVRGWYPDEVLVLAADGKALFRRDGRWSYHEFGASVVAFAASDGQGNIYLATAGAAGAPPSIYRWYFGLDRPALSTDSDVRRGDNSDTPLTCHLYPAQWWPDDGREVSARNVIVDGEQVADAGQAASLSITAKATFANTSDRTSAAQAISFAAGGSGNRRDAVGVGDQGSGGALEVLADSIIALKLWRIAAELVVDPPRGDR